MGRTVYYVASSLDGFIADPANHLDWLVTRQIDQHGPLGYQPFIARVGAIAMGATTYRWLVAHLVAAGEPWPYRVGTWVFAHHEPDPSADSRVRVVAGDVRPVHAEMAAAAGERDVWVVGGGALAGQFADQGLLDEIVVAIAPVTLGAGSPLLPRRLELELVESARNGEFACARFLVRR